MLSRVVRVAVVGALGFHDSRRFSQHNYGESTVEEVRDEESRQFLM